MSVINDYLTHLKKQYPDTKAVNEQLEELRDTLHIKTEEYQSQGYGYDEAAHAAMTSLGDVTPLLDEVSGRVKSVFINRLNRNNALYISVIILGELMLGWLGYSLFTGKHVPFGSFIVSLAALLLGIGIWVAITFITQHQEPDKTAVVDYPFKKLIKMALIGWVVISVLLFAANMLIGAPVWFMWPVIGIANWPVNIYLYHRQLTGGRYDAIYN